jgi:8-oxo-dGTP diphosphatase
MQNEEKEKVLLHAVLVFLVTDEHAVMGEKTKKIGKGKLNAYGGGVEEGESHRRAAVRETEEESRRSQEEMGIQVLEEDLEPVAICYFKNTTKEGKKFTCRVVVYFCKKWVGEIVSSEDIRRPAFYLRGKPPVDRMMLADKIWIPEIFAGKKIIVHAEYGPGQETLIGEVEIEYENSFPEE